MKANLALRRDGTDGRLLWFAMLPLFVLAEGMRRAVAGLRHDSGPPTRRNWFAEAKSQASIATSYALLARSMLH